MLYSDDFILRVIRGDYTEDKAAGESASNALEMMALFIIKFGMILVFGVIFVLCHIPLISSFYESFARTFSRGAPGFFLRGAYYKTRLKRMGKNVFIDVGVTIWEPGNVEIGDNSHIDTYVTMLGGSRGNGYIKIGKHVHIVSNCVLSGRGGITVGDYSGIAAGSHIYSATNTYHPKDGDGGEIISMSGAAPAHRQHIIEGPVNLAEYTFVGTGSVVLPGVTLGRGAVVGSGSVVKTDIPPMTIAAGAPAKVIKQRPQPRKR